MFATIQTRDGKHVDPEANSLTQDAVGNWVWFLIGRSDFERLNDEPVTILASVYLTLFGDRQSIAVPVTNQAVALPGAGRCFADSTFVRCLTEFRDPDHRISVTSGPLHSDMFNAQLSYSPFPADGFSPIRMVGQPEELTTSDVVILTEKPLAHFHRDVEFRDVRLPGFAVQSTIR